MTTEIHELVSEINRKRRLSIAKAIFDDIEKALRTDRWSEEYEKLKRKWLE